MTRYTIKAVMLLHIDAETTSDAIDVAQVATANYDHLEGVEFEGGSYAIVSPDMNITGKQFTAYEWIEYGWRHGWCSPPVCETHDGFPMSDAESEQSMQGDPCLHILRLYESPEHKAEVESPHAPPQWRGLTQGWTA